MQQQIEMEALAREERGKNAARRLRAGGRVPAVVCGLGQPSRAVSLDTKAITGVLKDPAGHNRVFDLRCEGSQEHAMAVDYQIDPVKHSLLHVDLQRIDLAKPVMVNVPVTSVGTAIGVKMEGGFEEMVSREVRIECLPLDIPDRIDVAVDDLALGQSIRVGDIPPNDKYKLVDDADKLILHVVGSRVGLDLDEPEDEEAEGEAAEGDGEEAAEQAE